MTQQDLNLTRVADRIGAHIITFCRARLAAQHPEFHAEDLLRFVKQREHNIAPDSPSRILRQLRKEGAIDYQLVDRRSSLYRVVSVAAAAA